MTNSGFLLGLAGLLIAALLWIAIYTRSRLKTALQFNHERQSRYQGLFESSLAGIALVSADGQPLEWNKRLPLLLGVDPEFSNAPDIVEVPWLEQTKSLARLAKKFPPGVQHETSFIAADGNRHWISLRQSPLSGVNNDGRYWLLINDVSALQADRTLLRLARTAYVSISEGIMITDVTTRIIDVNPAFERITGYSHSEVIGMRASLLRSERHDAKFFADLWNELSEQNHWVGEIWNRCRDGRIIPCQMHIDAVAEPDSDLVTHYVGVFSDISERKLAEDRISFMAHHDALTGLANRFALDAVLPQSIAMSRRNGQHLALLFADLDHFKSINDRFGHAVGDQVLIEVGRRLMTQLRESDFLARIGGDEFVILLNEIDSSDDALRVAESIMAALQEPIIAGGEQMSLSFSIGISMFPEDGKDALALLKGADAAMYQVKSNGRNDFGFHTHPQV